VLARRTVVALAVIVIASVPFAAFAVISGQVAASSWALLGGAAVLMNLIIGGRTIAYLTPAVVLFTGSSIADVPKTDAQRLALTLIGCALILLASGVAVGWAHYQKAHSPLAAAES
jgi:hypothetical protein